MKLELTKEEAISLLQQAATLQYPEFAVLCYASDRIAFTQALYRARKGDPMLEAIQIRQLNEGVALLNPHFNEASLQQEWDKATAGSPDGAEGTNDDGEYDDPEIS